MPVSQLLVPSRSQLRAVFSLCDPHNTGFVSLDRLLELGNFHCQGTASPKDVERTLRQLDPERRGIIGFQEFCRGVSALLAGGGESTMMAPTEPPSFVLTRHDGDDDSALGGSTSPELNGKSQCSSMSDGDADADADADGDGQSFEGYGDMDLEGDAVPRGEDRRSPLARHTWLRTSLRRTPSNHHENLPNRRWGSFRHSGKRLGSNALASQLYRSSSFNSSGRSSNCDTADDMYSDVSLEEDVLDLNHKVQMLQQQVSVLADNQINTDDRYTRAKQDSAALQARVHMLEEQLREAELRADERLQEEQKRHKELMIRVEREKQLQMENCTIRLQTLESEAVNLREEAAKLRSQAERFRTEKQSVEEQLAEAEAALSLLQDESRSLRELERRLKEEAAHERLESSQLIEELSREVELYRQNQERLHNSLSKSADDQQDDELSQRFCELQEELSTLRQHNKSLQESNEELQAQILTRSLEEGRTLLTAGIGPSNSLAAELEAMSNDELSLLSSDHFSLEQMRKALKEQQEVNMQLRAYIDGMLLNIVDNYPQLLEVKAN